MKRRTRTAVLTVVPLVVLIGVGSAFAHGYRNGKDGERMKRFVSHRVEEKLDDLDATDAQRERILGVVSSFVDKQVALRDDDQRAVLAEAIAKAIASDSPDTSEIDRLIDEHAASTAAMAHQAVAAAVSVHAALTPAQRQALADEVREHASQRHPGPPF